MIFYFEKHHFVSCFFALHAGTQILSIPTKFLLLFCSIMFHFFVSFHFSCCNLSHDHCSSFAYSRHWWFALIFFVFRLQYAVHLVESFFFVQCYYDLFCAIEWQSGAAQVSKRRNMVCSLIFTLDKHHFSSSYFVLRTMTQILLHSAYVFSALLLQYDSFLPISFIPLQQTCNYHCSSNACSWCL